jgi:hypothetical protein
VTTGTTPRRYRLWSLVAAFALAAAATVGAVVAVHMGSVTERTRRNTGPVLVATQGLVASLAEADAAATAAFLSGRDEDREQRRLYEQALARAHAQIEDMASLVGDDPLVHDALGALLVEVSRYAGLVEAARAGGRGGLPGAERSLVEALGALALAVDRDIGTITTRMQGRFTDAQEDRSKGVELTVAVLLGAALVLVAAQVVLARRTRRLVNPPLVLATVATLGAAAWLAVADARAGDHLETARRDGYESIVLTARIQALGNRTRTAEALALVTRNAAYQAEAGQAAAQLASLPDGGLLREAAQRADSPRERAATTELHIRWARYRAAAAEGAVVGPLSAAFNGFNFTVESVLADNRDQFVQGLADADDAQRGLLAGLLGLPLLAMAAELAGFQLRIDEYR